MKRVHLFTLIQLACLIVLWVIKSFSRTSILFPLMLVVMIGIRKSLDCVFTRRELKILDDVMPEMTRRAAADDMKDLEGGSSGEVGIFQRLRIFCLGTAAASHAQISRSKRSCISSSRQEKTSDQKDHPELRVAYKAVPNDDLEAAHHPIPNPIHFHSSTNGTNIDCPESHVPLLTTPC